MEGSLKGQLLIATPQLADYFRRSVVLVLEHNEEGAMGVVLNRPTDTPVAEAVPDLADLAGQDSLVHAGGPVNPSTVIALGDVDGEPQLLGPDDTALEPRRLRVFAGYAGWAPGQLDGELEEEAWITEPADPGDPFAEGDLWPEVLQRKGGGYALLATMPPDPSLN